MRKSYIALVIFSPVISVLLFFLINSTQAGGQVGAYDFKIETKIIDGVVVEYTPGLISLTTQPEVSLEGLDSLISKFEGEIIDSWRLKKEMILMYFWNSLEIGFL